MFPRPSSWASVPPAAKAPKPDAIPITASFDSRPGEEGLDNFSTTTAR